MSHDLTQYVQELEQDEYDPKEFVERTAWRTLRGTSGDDFDPDALHTTFQEVIYELQAMYENYELKVKRAQSQCAEEEAEHKARLGDHLRTHQAAVGHFSELDSHINFVATKILHLGDQLESVNIPRARGVEAQKLMNYFAEFLQEGSLTSVVFTDPFRLDEAADVIQKLNLIAQELPSEKFEAAKKRISAKYDDIEKSLIEEFVVAHKSRDKIRMKELATILSHFKGYSQCIDAFIDESQKAISKRGKGDVFIIIKPLCEETNSLVQEIFTTPESVMAKFVLNIFHGKLQEYIQATLEDKRDPERYLRNLYDFYSKTVKLSNELSNIKMGNDSTFLPKLTKHIYSRHLENYISVETYFLKEKCALILQRYYESRNHQKKTIQSGGLSDLRRDFQRHIGGLDNYGGETFLSEEVSINLLQECKVAFRRCQTLSSQSDLPGNAVKILEILENHLCWEHMDYAIELALQNLPPSEPKQEPDVYFFDVVRQCNAIFHLFEKLFSDSLVPLVNSTPWHSECLQRKKNAMEQIEIKLDSGLDRSIMAVVGWIRNLLSTEQRKTDFKPEHETTQLANCTYACSKVIKFMDRQIENIKDSLDGKNVEAVLMELGIRFHRVVYDHLQQYQYNTVGAMIAICDINEYRKCVKQLKLQQVSLLFETLHALCNLLLVVPANIKQVCYGEQLAILDRNVLLSFLQLRTDYKSAKIANQFK